MALVDWCRDYLQDINSRGQVLTLNQEKDFLEFCGINPVDPSSSNIVPPSNNDPGSSSPTIPPSRYINVNPVALKDSAYLCGNPGGVVSRRNSTGGPYQLPSCSWNWASFESDFVSFPLQLRYVEDGSKPCTTDGDCDLADVCGLSAENLDAKSTEMSCGELKGYWTADQICGVNPSFESPFECPLLYNLYGCVGGTVSCYNNATTSNCCGCADWWDVLGLSTAIYPRGTQPCVNKNPKWVNNIQPLLKPLKKICPTAYTFPFDDKSSTFICNNGESSTKPLDYFIVFCPDSDDSFVRSPISSNNDNPYRTIRFVNKCTFKVWPAIAGGSAFNLETISLTAGQVTNCNSDADCIDGTACIPTGAINQCFWKNPAPEGTSSYEMAAANDGPLATLDFHLPIGSDTGTKTPIVWSGIMTGRQGCSSLSATTKCYTSDCGKNTTGDGCKPGQGFIQPGWQAEFTFQVTEDYYDVEVINGAIIGENRKFGIEIFPDSDLK